jgi:nucleolysin TIA-1/TIAR
LHNYLQIILQQEIRANWAQQANNSVTKEDTATHFHVFVGDIAPEITDEALVQAFSAFGTMS